MSLSRGTINPLSALNLRKVGFCPEHFTKITVSKNVSIKLLERWIEYNLNSRYAVQEKFIVDSNNKITLMYEIGLEDPKEITMLSLGCSYIHKNKEDIF
jgi:hypothetical protein